MMAFRFIMGAGLLDIQGRPRSWTGLHCAVLANDLSDIHKQIENGADIDARTDKGETALHIACRYSNSECIEALLKYKPCMNMSENIFARTPLIILVTHMRHKSSLLKKMLELGANPNISRNNRDTPLHIIAKGEYGQRTEGIRYASLLLEYEANVNAKNIFHNTPLHEAIEKGFKKIIPILLKNGASIKIKNSHRFSPLELAFKRQRKFHGPLDEIVKYIIIKLDIEKQANKELLDEIYRFRSLKLYKDRCDEELVKLKNTTIGGSHVTYYDLLISPVNIVAKYLRNRDILESVIEFDEKKYLFGRQFSRIFQDALRQKEATEIGYEFCRKVFPFELTEFCFDLILKHLTYEDLLELKNFTSL